MEHGILISVDESRATSGAGPQSKGLQASLKFLFTAIASALAVSMGLRLVLLPEFCLGPSPYVIVPVSVAALFLTFAWVRLSRPGSILQIILIAVALAGLMATAYGARVIGLWPLPAVGACCALLITYPQVKAGASISRLWGLTSRQWALAALLAIAIVGIGLVAWFSHGGESREAHVLVRHVATALSVLALWSIALARVQNGVRLADVRPSLLFLAVSTNILLYNFALLYLEGYLNAHSTQKASNDFDLYGVILAAIIISFILSRRMQRYHGPVVLTLALLWAILVGAHHNDVPLPSLPFVALLPLVVHFSNLRLAAAYWLAMVAGPAIGIGITNPLFVVNAMAATIVFAGSYRLSRILDAYSAEREAKDGAADKTVKFSQGSADIDGRSALVGLAVAAVVALIGGALLYDSYSSSTRLEQQSAQDVAGRLALEVQLALQKNEFIAADLKDLDLRAIASQQEFTAATRSLAKANPSLTLQWAPQADVRFIVPLQGNKQAAGLDLRAMPEQQIDLRHVIATGEPLWVGPFTLTQGEQALIYSLPVYKPGAAPSEASLIGLAQVLVRLKKLIQDKIQFDQARYDLAIWLTNPSTANAAARPQLVWGSSSPDEGDAKLTGIYEASGAQDGGVESLKVRVKARPRHVGALDVLPARLQGLMIVVLLSGAGGALAASNRRKVITSQAALVLFKSTLDQTHDAVFLIDAETLAFTYVNRGACDQVGYDEAELLTLHPYDIKPEYPEPKYRELIAPLLEGRQTSTRFETLHRRKDGCDVPVEVLLQLVRPEGEPARFVAIATDISLRKVQERKLQETLQKLQASNEQLGQFAYVASHDLQEPLRAISGCVQLLARQLGPKLDAPARELIDHTVQGSIRMQDLIRDLLAYSRLSQYEKPLAPISLESVLDDALVNLEKSIQETGAVVVRDALPSVAAQRTQMVQVFQNLVGNAIKFRGKRRPEIHILAQHEPHFWKIAVKDNGIGLKSEYAERIFKIFQRLHTRDTYAGTGIGLAICQKIVHQHGGRIWVESVPGEGSTFFFTIPDAVSA